MRVAADDDPVFDDDPERMYRTVRVLATALARRRAKIAAGIRVDPPPQCGCKKCADAGGPEDALDPPHQEHDQHDHQDDHEQANADVHLARLLAQALNIVGQLTEEPGNRRRQGGRAGQFLHAGTWPATDFHGDADMAEAVDLPREIPHEDGCAGLGRAR
jgi:hypothetical protein